MSALSVDWESEPPIPDPVPGTPTAVTYIRRSDRTRLVFWFDCPPDEAVQRASELAPLNFKLAAVCQPKGRLAIPFDGDNYGKESPSPRTLMPWSKK